MSGKIRVQKRRCSAAEQTVRKKEIKHLRHIRELSFAILRCFVRPKCFWSKLLQFYIFQAPLRHWDNFKSTGWALDEIQMIPILSNNVPSKLT